jgi:RNase adaptor protein for sRNA GlmZ degradation
MLIFLEASHTALVRRFSETRRPHPLARDRSVSEGITEERHKLNAIRAMADLIIDTTISPCTSSATSLCRCRVTVANGPTWW